MPDALGCPKGLILNDVACVECNSKLGREVDSGLVKQFEMITVMQGVRRKKGRRPTIASWAALTGTHTTVGPEIHLNAGPGVVEAMGKKLHPANKSNGISDVWMKRDGDKLAIGFSQVFGDDTRFLPALFKIGLNLVAYFFGPQVAADKAYDHIRRFVFRQEGVPALTVAMEMPEGSQKGTGNPKMFTKEGRDYPMFQIEILGVFFLLDMSPDQSMLRDLRGAATLMDQPLYVFPV